MSCTPFLKTKPIHTCIGELTIGKVSPGNIDVTVYIEDCTTGATNSFDATAGADGTVTLDLGETQFDGIEWSDKHSYIGWVTKKDANLHAEETVYIGGGNGQQFELNFERCTFEGEEMVATDETLQPA